MHSATAEPSTVPMTTAAPRRRWSLNPVIMMLAAMAVAVALTWIVPSGRYERTDTKENAPVIAGTYRPMEKPIGLPGLIPGKPESTETARPVSPLAVATAIPAGLEKSAGLIFMILLLGGMFGVLKHSGALDAGIQRLIGVSGGRVTILVPVLMIAISAGSTFLGLISEYLLLIPVMVALADRLGRSPMFGFALLTLAAKVGYLASVTSPVALLIAQPIVGVPVFSGLALRLWLWIAFLAIAIVWVLAISRPTHEAAPIERTRLTHRQFGVLLVIGVVVALLVYGSLGHGWDDKQFAALFIVAAMVIGLIAGMAPSETSRAFLDGMRSMMLAGLLIGMGRGVEIILREGHILDTIIAAVSWHIEGLPPMLVAPILMAFEMLLTLLIPSTSAKAALSIPVLGPIAAQAGVSGQTTVLCFLMGNGLVNMLAPTSGMLLAYLAAANIPYNRWFRFVWPIFALLTALSVGVAMLAVVIGY
ncbi:YfcC family protein [Sphingobium estronivorans]|uniref:YfcC family protein n=1 Tax=Sphingobium estronivorans TaxID=1577690 RepID=UPI00123A7A6E|nr:YfcC family protein [Sphingobium estronivorans]